MAAGGAQYAYAQRLRQGLESVPWLNRTPAEYERVLDAYRAVYRANRASPNAAASAMAVADLLAEEGRVLHSPRPLHAAIAQYEFVRTQYPASGLSRSALLTEGEIWQNDLGQPAQAATIYREYLRLYPRSSLAGEARSNLRMVGGAAPVYAARQSGPVQRAAVGYGATTASAPEAEVASRAEKALPAARAGGYSSGYEAGQRLTPITAIQHWSTPVYTRVAIYLGRETPYRAGRVPNPDRVYFDLYGTRLARALREHTANITDDGFLKRIQVVQLPNNITRVVLRVDSLSEYSAFFLAHPARLIIDIHGRQGGGAQGAPPQEVAETRPSFTAAARRRSEQGNGARWDAGGAAARRAATLSSQPDEVAATVQPTTAPVAAVVPGTEPAAEPSAALRARTETGATAAGAQVPGTMVRTLGLKIDRIVIDPGHGGYDPGTIGPGGIEEKDVALDVALRLGRLLKDRLGADVIYTRTTDTFVPLETRTAIANKAQADLFISIHANSSPDPETRGVEVYYLNFTTSANSLQVAARENSVDKASVYQLSNLVKKIALNNKIDESRAFAEDVDQSLYAGLERNNPGMRNRGVKKAPFVVLIGANMPSILAEISFLSNPESARELRRPAYQERVAEALYRGVARYVDSVNGVRIARNGRP